MPNIAIKDMLKWIDAQRDVVNTLINVAPPDRKDQYMPELYVINAIAERVQEMTAVEYLEAKRKYCDWARQTSRCAGVCWESCIWEERNAPCDTIMAIKRWKEEQDEGTNRV